LASLRKALKDAGYPQVPVLSLSIQNFEKNPGFKITLPLLHRAMIALVYGDLLMKCLYRVRPYEKVPGSANALYEKWAPLRTIHGLLFTQEV
jgi:predicted nucleotide-binding protein (sugar kinase/HSP70/actin superfamily)